MFGIKTLLSLLNGVSPSGAVLGTAVAFFGYLSTVGVEDPSFAALGVMMLLPALIFAAVADDESV